MTARSHAAQIAALPWRRRNGGIEILLVTSRETHRWVIPKGWPMDHLIASNAAKQEAWEEAGVRGCVRRAALGCYRYRKRTAKGTARPCQVTVYALQVQRELRAWPEREERQRCWFPAELAADLVAEAELRDLILSFIRR